MSSIICTAIQEVNKALFFQSDAIQIGTIKDHPDTVKELAE